MKIFEGMWSNDLEDLLQPLVSIDEYESKIDDGAIVMAFFINDRDAADDLSRFIQKSSVPIIDSDVSPAPDQRGYYLVFCELAANDRFVENLCSICEEVGQLGGIDNWQMKLRGKSSFEPLDPKKISWGLMRNKIVDRMAKLTASLAMLKENKPESE